jgi:hypothetical protein
LGGLCKLISVPALSHISWKFGCFLVLQILGDSQILEEAAGALPSSGIAKFSAADWIYDRAFGHLGLALRPEFQQISKLDKPEIVRQIENVLRLLHDEKLEVCKACS